MKKKNEKKNNLLLILGVLLIAIIVTVGYAELRTQLSINGTAQFNGNINWSVRFDEDSFAEYGTGNLQLNSTQLPSFNNTSTILDFTVPFTQPGQKYQFTIDVKNYGTIGATLDSTTPYTISNTGRSDIIFQVQELVSGSPTDLGTTPNLDLAANQSRTLLVSVWFDETEATAQSISNTTPISLTFQLNYVQAS